MSSVEEQARPAVFCRNTVKEFGDGDNQVFALAGVDFEALFGELTLLVGPSGCGKTTLLSVIVGILDPTSGEVQVLGTDLAQASSGEKTSFRAQNIGFVFQQYNLIPSLNAAENVAVPLLIAGYNLDEALVKAAAALETVDMTHRADSFPDTLSGGEQQRVAIARALAHEPRLVVCDEPTSALDHHTGQTIMELLRHVAVQPDRAVVVVTHDPRVYAYGDRIAHMDDGRVVKVEVGKAGELVSGD